MNKPEFVLENETHKIHRILSYKQVTESTDFIKKNKTCHLQDAETKYGIIFKTFFV